ncbi:MAG TPA: RloB family protein [Candidatus Limnocylindrales bacterium]
MARMPREIPLRRQPFREPKRTVLIFCGAKRTEPDYFEGLKVSLRTASVTIKVKREGVDPVRLVRAAADLRDRRPGVYDEVWCVTDADEFDIPAAVSAAKRRGVNLAVSNPCFEVWLLLHHAECQAHCRGYADVLSRLKRHVPGYDKTALDFAVFADRVGDAVERAEKLDPTGTDFGRNPSSGVWMLAKKLMGHKK